MTDIKLTTNDDSTVTIEGEIATAELEKHRGAALDKLGSNVSIDGFRKGHVPHDVLVKHLGEYTLLEEMANRALSEAYPRLLIEHKIDAIGHPQVAVTKLASGNPLGFRITTAVMPRLTLPDYKKLAAAADKPSDDVVVTDDEVEAFIKNLLDRRSSATDSDGKPKDPSSEASAKNELTDDIAKTFGNFKDAADMRAKVKDGMTLDKKRESREKHRMAILDKLVAETSFVLPALIVDAEAGKLMAQLEMDLERMGLKPDDYFAKIGKTRDEVRAEMRPDAEKRARIQLIINEIALAEKLAPTKDEVSAQVEKIFEGHEPHEGHDEADERERAAIYVTTVLTNEKVLKFLEELV